MHVICFQLGLPTYKEIPFCHCILLYCAIQILCFLQIKGKTLHQQKMTHCIVVVGNRTRNISEVGL